MQDECFNLGAVEKSLKNLKSLCGLFQSSPKKDNHHPEIRNVSGLAKESLSVLANYISDREQSKANSGFHLIFDEVNKCLSSIESSDFYNELSCLSEYRALRTSCFYPDSRMSDFSERENIDKKQEVDFDSCNDKTCLNNLIEIKKDGSYELFYLRDTDGKKFYTEALVQILSKYGRLHENCDAQNPFIKTILWSGLEKYRAARQILTSVQEDLKLFYKFALANFSDKIAVALHNAIMALMMAGSDNTCPSKKSSKTNLEYFRDFFYFLRNALKIIKDFPLHENHSHLDIYRKLSKNLCRAFFSLEISFTETIKYLIPFLTDSVSQKLSEDKYLKAPNLFLLFYDNLTKELSKYPSGPVFKALDIISKDESIDFDPHVLGFFPSFLQIVKNKDYSLKIMSAPCPTVQKSIAYADLVEEFSYFMDSLKETEEKLFVINLQNRLSKKDKARCALLEDFFLRTSSEEVVFLTIPEPEEVLRSLESERGIVEDLDEFLSVLKHNISFNERSQYRMIAATVFLDREFLHDLLLSLKDVFFSRKRALFRNDKLLLLELMNLNIAVKIIDIYRPQCLLALSKDGLDRTSAFCFCLENLLDPVICLSKDSEYLKTVFCRLMASTMTLRDRLMRSDSFDITVKVMNSLRKHKDYMAVLGKLFDADLGEWKIID
ncbi:MAG: hypothetical protein RSB82_03630 [Victivallaceae bacterium]